MRVLHFFVLASLSVVALASAPSKATFQKQYDKLSRAFEHKDEKAYFAILAPDFHQEMKGRPPMTGAQIKADFKRQMDSLSNVRWVRTVLSVQPGKGGYDVKVTGHLTGTTKGPNGKSHHLVLDGVTLDHWTKGMKIEDANVQTFNLTIDGRKIG